MNERTARVEAIAASVSALATVVAVAFVMLQINFAKRQYLAYQAERSTEKMDAFRSEWVTPTMLSYRARAAQQFPGGSPHLFEVFTFFERVARAQTNGVVSARDVAYYFQTDMLGYWCAFEPWVKANRIANGQDPETGEIWRGFQLRVQELKKQEKVNCFTAAEVAEMMQIEQQRYVLLHVVPPDGMQPFRIVPPQQVAQVSSAKNN